MERTDVVIVGAGPVGLLLAAELTLGGARAAVLERLTEPSETIKAGSINLASAELLARRGLLPRLRAASERTIERVASGGGVAADEAWRLAARAGHFAGLWLDGEQVDDSTGVLADHQHCLGATLVPQQELEAVLAEYAAGLGVDVRRGVEVIGVGTGPGGVTVSTDAGDIGASWLVGCDGGRSVVRRAAGFDFPGTDPEITGRQAVLDLDSDAGLTRGWNWSTRGVYCYGPMPGRVLTVEFDGPPADRDAPVTALELQESLRRVSGSAVRVEALAGAATRWTDNARQATTYRQGRVLLAGDAAHVHSPFSGQGLNLGLADAMNLGWKLAAVCTGRAGDDLLDTYTTERHPAAAWVLDWTRAQVALMRPDPKNAPLRQTVADLMGTREGATLIATKIAGVARAIPLEGDHPATGTLVGDLETRDGDPVHDLFVEGGFVLVLPAGFGENGAVDGVATVERDGDTALLVRPDGVVVWADDRPTPGAVRDAVDRLVPRRVVGATAGSPR